ncbi:hypothetical protein ACF0H5_018573 [Mactra antiquata]
MVLCTLGTVDNGPNIDSNVESEVTEALDIKDTVVEKIEYEDSESEESELEDTSSVTYTDRDAYTTKLTDKLSNLEEVETKKEHILSEEIKERVDTFIDDVKIKTEESSETYGNIHTEYATDDLPGIVEKVDNCHCCV